MDSLLVEIDQKIIMKTAVKLSSGTLSNDDGSENFAKKTNLRSFKLNRVYLDPLIMSNAGDFSWSWILKDLLKFKN